MCMANLDAKGPTKPTGNTVSSSTDRESHRSVPRVENTMCGQTKTEVSPALGHQQAKLLAQHQAENRTLRNQLAEAIESNKKWLAYDHKRDELVNTLLAKNKDLQLRLSQPGPISPPCHTQGGEAELEASQVAAFHWKKKSEEEESLRKHLEKVNRRQQLFIQDLQRAADQDSCSCAKKHQQQQRPEDRERIELLENQVQVFSEDFDQERRDRERAQSRIAELEMEVRLLHQQLSQFQTSHMSYLADRRQATMDAYRDEYARQVAIQQQHQDYQLSSSSSPPRSMRRNDQSRLIAHGYVHHDLFEDGVGKDNDNDSDDDDDILDVPMACGVGSNRRNTQGKAQPERTNSSSPQQATLECPKCQKQFPVTDPLMFLEHNDQCNV